MTDITVLENSALGKKALYQTQYDPSLLFAIARSSKRAEIGIQLDSALPFSGFDRWNHYEVSWLNEKGKPVVAIAEIIYDCTSPNIVESKALKLYFNSFNGTKFVDITSVTDAVKRDLTACVGADVIVKIIPLQNSDEHLSRGFSGFCLDKLDITCDQYIVEPNYLTIEHASVTNESLYSDLLKSNCLVTNQPDWGSVCITYTGKKINREGLLKYLVSFRNHNEFHEQCIERIFMDIMRQCRPEELTVDGRYTRRGGLDINPYRTTDKAKSSLHNKVTRLCRQ